MTDRTVEKISFMVVKSRKLKHLLKVFQTYNLCWVVLKHNDDSGYSVICILWNITVNSIIMLNICVYNHMYSPVLYEVCQDSLS